MSKRKLTDTELLNYVEFVATKFEASRKGWVYSRDMGDLEHIRYRSDYTGPNHWTKRLRRAFDLKHLLGRDSISRGLGISPAGLKDRWLTAATWIEVSLKKEKNLPDGIINGIPTNWEEDGEYLTALQPRVGAKVIEFLRAEPENPHAKAILAEMHACVELSDWTADEDDEDAEIEESSEEA